MQYYQSIELETMDETNRDSVQYNADLLLLKTLVDQRLTSVAISHWLIAIQIYCLWPLSVAQIYSAQAETHWELAFFRVKGC